MSIRAQIRKAGFPTTLVSFTNTPQGTLASFPAMGQQHGWYEDVPVDRIIPTMEWSSWMGSEDDCEDDCEDEE